eukprot:384178-Prymnesium_polylepis.1
MVRVGSGKAPRTPPGNQRTLSLNSAQKPESGTLDSPSLTFGFASDVVSLVIDYRYRMRPCLEPWEGVADTCSACWMFMLGRKRAKAVLRSTVPPSDERAVPGPCQAASAQRPQRTTRASCLLALSSHRTSSQL